MRIARVVLALTLGAFLLAGAAACDDTDAIDGSGDFVTQSFELSGFEAVALGHAFEAEIVRGAEFEVTVTIDDNLLDRLVVERRGDGLTVGLESGSNVRNARMQVRVVLPVLRRLEVSGASRAEFVGFEEMQAFDIDASGATRVTGRLSAEDLGVRLSGASRAELSGSASRATLEASGASSFEIADLTVREASVDLSGASRMTIRVLDAVSGEVSGASSLRLVDGEGVSVDVDVSEGSSVER
jgi:hypothetical protein